ncbi:hypothetical protein OG937_16640 [Streptomyces sp. NBC_00510]
MVWSNAVTAFRRIGSVPATSVLGAVLAVRFIGALPERLTAAHVPPPVADAVVAVARSGGSGSGLWVVAGVSFAAAVPAAVFLARRPAAA